MTAAGRIARPSVPSMGRIYRDERISTELMTTTVAKGKVKLKEARSKLPTVRTEIGSEAGCGRQAGWDQRSPKVIKTHQVEPDGPRGEILHLTWGDLSRETGEGVSRDRSSEEGR